MSDPIDLDVWWRLHLRKARGETLSDQEQQLYDEELARQESTAPPLQSDLEGLKQLRQRVLALASDNADLRSRLSELDKEIHRLEQSLSQATRQVLGVGE